MRLIMERPVPEMLFRQLAESYSPEPYNDLWQEIALAYSEDHRFYHDLSHLVNLLEELAPAWDNFADRDAVMFALFYHDSIYDVKSRTNEEESADLARRRMVRLQVPLKTIKAATSHIMATKSHAPTGNGDTDLFTDADLSILGKPEEQYMNYSRNVRKEYEIYPDELYVPARMSVLQRFLDKRRIYKTELFSDSYENAAIANMKSELEQLASLV
jgi:predicted metal-dependent HD superfamily phosphohydrolase